MTESKTSESPKDETPETPEFFYPASGISPHKLPPKETRKDTLKYFSPFSHPFLNSWDRSPAIQSFKTLDERALVALSYTIRQKPEWWIKYKNPEIVAKWKEETKDQIREALFDFIIAELEWHEKLRDESGQKFQLGPYDYIYYGDGVVSNDLKTKFKTAAKRLEDVSESEKDWHPGSNQRVLDLVHPSLYPLQYEITPIVADPKKDHVGLNVSYNGECVKMPEFDFKKDSIKNSVEKYGIGKKYQWLPSIFDISKDGKVTIESYINNLHPIQNKDLYQPIADIFSEFIPGINASLTQYATGEIVRVHPFTNEEGLYGPDPEDMAKLRDSEEDDDWDRYEEWKSSREPVPPIPEFEMPDEEEINHIDIRGTKLKVIVKMANIELTPERPDYPGGTWHVEGTINEDIVATCLYYYDSENITFSELKFRAGTADPYYEQGDSNGTRIVFGIEDEQPMIFNIGGVEATEDRLLVFPNIFQHYVSPFELKDKTKPGHRKILCFFICDPYNDNIVSTDQVPPQQANWWSQQLMDVDEKENNITRLHTLPAELMNEILEKVEWPMPLQKAKEVREDLMKERSISTDFDESDDAYQRTFSLCEH